MIGIPKSPKDDKIPKPPREIPTPPRPEKTKMEAQIEGAAQIAGMAAIDRPVSEGTKHKYIKVFGKNSAGEPRKICYIYPEDAKSDFEAIKEALNYADGIYNSDWVFGDGKAKLTTIDKEFTEITSVEITNIAVMTVA